MILRAVLTGAHALWQVPPCQRGLELRVLTKQFSSFLIEKSDRSEEQPLPKHNQLIIR